MFKAFLWIMKGPVRAAKRLALEAVIAAAESGDVVLETRAWKTFFLICIYRLLLLLSFKSVGVQKVLPAELARRVELFFAGQWEELFRDSRIVAPRTGRKRINGDE